MTRQKLAAYLHGKNQENSPTSTSYLDPFTFTSVIYPSPALLLLLIHSLWPSQLTPFLPSPSHHFFDILHRLESHWSRLPIYIKLPPPLMGCGRQRSRKRWPTDAMSWGGKEERERKKRQYPSLSLPFTTSPSWPFSTHPLPLGSHS